MDFLYKLIGVLVMFFAVHAGYTLFGFVLVRFRLTHRLGLRLMAMGFASKSCPLYCRLDCSKAKCGNWTCPKFLKK